MKELSKHNDARAERLNSLIFSLKMNVTDFATTIGYDSAETIYRILHKRQGMSIITADKIKDTIPEVNIMWLLYGEGDMKGEDVGIVARLKKENELLTEIVKRYEIIMGTKSK